MLEAQRVSNKMEPKWLIPRHVIIKRGRDLSITSCSWKQRQGLAGGSPALCPPGGRPRHAELQRASWLGSDGFRCWVSFSFLVLLSLCAQRGTVSAVVWEVCFLSLWIRRSGRRPGLSLNLLLGFPGDLAVKNVPANAGDIHSIPGTGRSHVPRSS